MSRSSRLYTIFWVVGLLLGWCVHQASVEAKEPTTQTLTKGASQEVVPRSASDPLRYRVAWVPLSHWEELLKQTSMGWVVSYQEWQQGWSRLQRWLRQENRELRRMSIRWQRMSVQGQVRGQLLQLEIELSIRLLVRGWYRIPVPFRDLRIAGVRLHGIQGSVVQEAGALALWVKGPVQGSVVIRAGSVVRKSPRGQSVSFHVPAVPVSQVNIRLPAGQEVHLTTPGLHTTTSAQETVVSGGLEGETCIQFRFRKAESSARTNPALSAEIATTYELQPNIQWVDANAVIKRQMGAIRQFSLQLPQDFRLMDLQAPKQVDFVYQRKTNRVLLRVLRWPSDNTLRLSLRCVRQEKAVGNFTFAPVQLHGAYAQTGTIMVYLDRRLRHRVESWYEARRVPSGPQTQHAGQTRLQFAYWRAGAKIVAHVRAITPKLVIHPQTQLQITSRQVRATFTLKARVEEGSVYRLEGTLPIGWKLFAIQDHRGYEMTFGHRNNKWWTVLPKRWTADSSHVVYAVAIRNIVLPQSEGVERRKGAKNGDLSMTWKLPQITVRDASFQGGRVTLVWPRFYQLQLRNARRLQALQSSPTHNDSARTSQMSWRITGHPYDSNVWLKRRQARVMVSAVARYRLKADWIQGTIELHCQVRDAGIRTLTVQIAQLPDQAPRFVARGNRVLQATPRKVSPGVTEWKLTLAREHFGSLVVLAHLQWQHQRSAEQVSLPLVRAAGDRLAKSFVTVVVADNTEVLAVAKGMETVDPLEIPKAIVVEQRKQRPLYAYRFRPGGGQALSLQLQHHPLKPLVDVVVRTLSVKATAAKDGWLQMEASYYLWTRENGYFAVRLPAHSELWSVTRNGQGIKPLLRDNQIQVVIGNHSRRGLHILKLVYALRGVTLPKTGGQVSLLAPTVPYPVQRSVWRLYLPKAFRPLRIHSTLHAMDTVQPRAFLLQALSFLRRQVGLLWLGFGAIVLLILWLSRLWILRMWLMFWHFWLRFTRRWWKALLITSALGLGALVLVIVGLSLSTKMLSKSKSVYAPTPSQSNQYAQRPTPKEDSSAAGDNTVAPGAKARKFEEKRKGKITGTDQLATQKAPEKPAAPAVKKTRPEPQQQQAPPAPPTDKDDKIKSTNIPATPLAGKDGKSGKKQTTPVSKTPPKVTTKPAVTAGVKGLLRDGDTRRIAGIRSLQIEQQNRGWLVGSRGLGATTSWSVEVYSEKWLRMWLMLWMLLSFGLWWYLGSVLPGRRFLLFWGGLLLCGGLSVLLEGLYVVVANAVLFGILGAGATYLLSSLWRSFVSLSAVSRLGATALLWWLCAGMGLSPAEASPPPAQTSQVSSVSSQQQIQTQQVKQSDAQQQKQLNAQQQKQSDAQQQKQADRQQVKPPDVRAQKPQLPATAAASLQARNWRSWLCEAHGNGGRRPFVRIYAPYQLAQKHVALKPDQPVLIPGVWWELLRMGGDAWCKRLPRHARQWIQASYQVKIATDQSVTGTAEFAIHLQRAGWYKIPLGLQNVLVEEAIHNKLPVSLSYHDDSYQILLKGPAVHRLTVHFKLRHPVKERKLTLSMPAVMGSTLDVRVAGSAWQVQVKDVAGSYVQQTPKETRYYAVLGQRRAVEISWRPGQQSGSVEEETSTLHTVTVVALHEHLVRVASQFTLTGQYRRRDRFSFVLPANILLEGVEGSLLRRWKLQQDKAGGRILTVLLERAVLRAQISLRYVRLRSQHRETLSIPLATPTGVGRRSGWLGITSSPALTWSLREAKHLEKRTLVDWKEEAAGWAGEVEEAFTYRHHPTLTIAVRPRQDKRKIDLVHRLFVSRKQGVMFSQVTIQGEGLPTFGFSLLVSSGVQIRRMKTLQGSPIRQVWEAGKVGTLRLIRIEWKKPMAQQQQIQIVADLPSPGAVFSLPIVIPRQTSRWSGKILVRTLGDLGLETENLEHLDSIPTTQSGEPLWRERNGQSWHLRLAYKFQRAYSGRVLITRIKASRRCKIWLHAHLGQSQHMLRALIHFRAAGAGARAFSVSLPAAFASRLEWTEKAGLVPEKGPVRNGRVVITLRSVRLLNRIRLAFRVRWQQAVKQPVQIPVILAEQVAQSEILLALTSPPDIRLQIKDIKQQGLVTIDPDDFPMEQIDKRVAFTGAYEDLEEIPILATYRTRKQSWSMAVPRELLKTDIAIRPQVETAQIETIISPQGQVWTQVRYVLRSAGLQFLQIRLPARSTLWQVRVAGRTVRPSQSKGLLLVPLPPRQTSDLAYAVQLVYARQTSLPTLFGTVQPQAPQLQNISVAETFWILYLPRHCSISDYDGNMEETVALHLVYNRIRSALGFYRKLESLSQVGKQSARKRAIRNLRRQWQKLRRLLPRGSGSSYDFRSSPAAAPPRGAVRWNKAKRKKSKALQQKLHQLKNTMQELERRHRRLEQREQKQQIRRQYQQRKRRYRRLKRYKKYRKYRRNRKYQKKQRLYQQQRRYRKYPRYRRYRQNKQQRPYPQQQMRNRKGSYWIPLHRQWTPRRLSPPEPSRRQGYTRSKACLVPQSQSSSTAKTTAPLTLNREGIQYTFVTVGGKPKLSIRLYRTDRLWNWLGWLLWGAAFLVLLLAWRKGWFGGRGKDAEPAAF